MKFCEIKDKNIAVGMYGISYLPDYKHWMKQWKPSVDWRNSNYNDTLLKILTENKNTIHHYFSTYHSEIEKELLADFHPVNYKFTDYTCNRENGSWALDRHSRLKETLNMFTEGCHDYYILTRFDLYFSCDHLSRCEVKESRLNVTSKHTHGNDTECICDNLYIFDKSVLSPFRSFVETLRPKKGDFSYYHKMHRLDNCPEISCMIDGSYYSHNCPVWKIKRR